MMEPFYFEIRSGTGRVKTGIAADPEVLNTGEFGYMIEMIENVLANT